jgi:tetratricopeptide (TPR) repeat protein
VSAIERVLIVDDSDPNALFWEMLLKDMAIPTIARARAGAEAIEALDGQSIQMIIVAWELPSIPGPVFVQKARSTRKRRHMPFVTYSKNMTEEDTSLIKQLGLDVLAAPIDKAKATEMVKAILDQAASETAVDRKLRAMEESIAAGRPAEVLKMVGPDVSKKGPHQKRYKVIIAETFFRLGSMDKAEKALNDAFAIDGDYMPAKYLRARFYTAAGKHEEAIKMLEELSSKSPKNIETLLSLGDAYLSADKEADAERVISQAMAIDPDSQQVNDSQGKLEIRKGNLELAAKLLAHTENGDEMARFYNSMGISLIAKSDFEKGIATYQSALDVLSTKAKLHLLFFNLGLAHKKKGDSVKALSYLCQSYVADPTFDKAYNYVAHLWQEMQTKKIQGGLEEIKLVKQTRQRYLDENPAKAEAIKKKLAERKTS